jgi:hypothetical protein
MPIFIRPPPALSWALVAPWAEAASGPAKTLPVAPAAADVLMKSPRGIFPAVGSLRGFELADIEVLAWFRISSIEVMWFGHVPGVVLDNGDGVHNVATLARDTPELRARITKSSPRDISAERTH